MAEHDNSGIFGLDDSNIGVEPSFLENQDPVDGSPTTNDPSQGPGQGLTEDAPSSAVSGQTPSYYNPDSGWAYQGTPPYQPYDGVTTSAPPEAIFQTSPWALPAQQSEGLTSFSQAPNAVSSAVYDHSVTGSAAPNTTPGQSSIHSLADDPTNVLSLSPEALSALTPSQREKLRNIAMPPHLQYHSPKSDSAISPGGAKIGDMSSPENLDAPKLNSRKRKSSADVDDDDDDDGDEQPVKKTAHNMIEKRYRTNLNDKIAALRDSVPALRIMSKSARGEDTTEDREELHGLTPAHKLNKATVLSKATEYIRHLEKRNLRLQDENQTMLQRISAFEKLFMAGAMNGTINPMSQPPTPMQFTGQEGQRYMNPPPMGTPPGNDATSPGGMIQVPDDMKRIIQAQMAAGQPYPVPPQPYQQQNANVVRQQQIQQQQQMQNNRWRNNAPYYGKLMVGSLAGLMVLEAVREDEQSTEKPEGRGLFGLPIHLLGYLASSMRVNVMGYHFSASQVMWSMRLLAVLGLVLWFCVPSVFAPSGKESKRKEQVRTTLQAASLASPIHVRRQAWLTAIQTVWVPRHNFFLEAAALVLKTMKLSLRNAIGVHGYQMLTGLTEEQETARVKAWCIALDAQLAGGDVEINKPRLTLTLLASGTLPNTPLRLMLKALHIRVILWELCSNPMQLGLVNLIAAKLARAMWNEARQLQQIRSRLGETDHQDELPDHLALLLQQKCDDVLNDSVIQRAHNLAWNLSTTHKVVRDAEGMDTVVEDEAVRSPMDAVAAWWSSQQVQQVLVNSLEISRTDERYNEAQYAMSKQLNLAIEAAPAGSTVQARALVARAVLVDEKRGHSIATALQAVDPKGLALDIPKSPVSTDIEVKAALQCAVAMAHVQRAGATTARESLQIMAMISWQSTMANMSLLGCTAAFKLMEHVFAHQAACPIYGGALERLSGSLRIWIGGFRGSESSLDQTLRHNMVERCLTITKSVVGMENDPGYGSMSECEESNEC